MSLLSFPAKRWRSGSASDLRAKRFTVGMALHLVTRMAELDPGRPVTGIRRTSRSAQQPPALAVSSVAGDSDVQFAACAFLQQLWVS